ncbi:RagB/SusD family nutrient uptake outer membrane protein [Rubrolithibacter danxiaensis]|uniref:RagB/SusD family nutrient uptake outer membrane protein n=1 Tax=Rubrolithibacter danxiaensis TaxID=3390805 RepID=UPI003BF9164D
MKLKYITPYTLAATLLLSMPACKDFVELTPISTTTASNAYNTASDAEAALVGVYDSFSQEYYIWDNVIASDVISDNYYAGGDNADIIAIDKLDISPTNGRLFANWTQLYNAIAKANLVLEKVPAIKDPNLDARREQILGEAAFLRAYHYYQLVNLFGGVPLITAPVSSTEPSATNIPRSTEEEVYNQIVTDLLFARDRLPDTYPGGSAESKARATKGAANAMLAKAFAQRPAKDYNKVLEYCNAVISSPAGYELLQNFDQLWDGTHYNNAESIMEVQFDGVTEGNFGPSLLLPPSKVGHTWRKFVVPSHDLINAFDAAGDVERKDATFLFESAPWVDEYWGNKVGSVIPFAYKWRSAPSWAGSSNRQYLIRLADIILLKAEALNELDKPISEVKPVLDEIRSRAGLPGTTAADKTQMRAAILNERRLELAQEAHRWEDLKRYGVAVQVMNNLNEIDLRTNTKTDYNATATDLLFPLPQQELNRNKNLTQNPGYN